MKLRKPIETYHCPKVDDEQFYEHGCFCYDCRQKYGEHQTHAPDFSKIKCQPTERLHCEESPDLGGSKPEHTPRDNGKQHTGDFTRCVEYDTPKHCEDIDVLQGALGSASLVEEEDKRHYGGDPKVQEEPSCRLPENCKCTKEYRVGFRGSLLSKNQQVHTLIQNIRSKICQTNHMNVAMRMHLGTIIP